MAAYNAENHIGAAIESVLNQSYSNFELLIINDGSADCTEQVIKKFTDSRIFYTRQVNQGVALARNAGLTKMKGQYFCFLDADDVMPKESISIRASKLSADKAINFVDGIVKIYDANLKKLLRIYSPSFEGNPLQNLFSLKENCFFGPTWMVRRLAKQEYRMKADLTHGEDLLFYMSISRNNEKYSYVDSEVLYYRSHDSSAMHNLDGLYNGYQQIFSVIKDWPEFSTIKRVMYQFKVRKIMFLSYSSRGQLLKAFLALLS